MEGKQYAIKLDIDVERLVTKPLEIVHSNFCGPMMNISIVGKKYFLTFVNEFLNKIWIYLMKSKGKLFQIFKKN